MRCCLKKLKWYQYILLSIIIIVCLMYNARDVDYCDINSARFKTRPEIFSIPVGTAQYWDTEFSRMLREEKIYPNLPAHWVKDRVYIKFFRASPRENVFTRFADTQLCVQFISYHRWLTKPEVKQKVLKWQLNRLKNFDEIKKTQDFYPNPLQEPERANAYLRRIIKEIN